MDPTQPSGFDRMFSLGTGFLLGTGFIGLVAALILGTILVTAVRYLTARRETAPAVCVTKRLQVSGGGGTGMAADAGAGAQGASTSYRATFEFADGSRKELICSGRQYGMLVEGDRGELVWKGSWLTDFRREVAAGGDARSLGGPVG